MSSAVNLDRFGSRTPPGVRELKHLSLPLVLRMSCRTPPGVRELKLLDLSLMGLDDESHPSWGA